MENSMLKLHSYQLIFLITNLIVICLKIESMENKSFQASSSSARNSDDCGKIALERIKEAALHGSPRSAASYSRILEAADKMAAEMADEIVRNSEMAFRFSDRYSCSSSSSMPLSLLSDSDSDSENKLKEDIDLNQKDKITYFFSEKTENYSTSPLGLPSFGASGNAVNMSDAEVLAMMLARERLRISQSTNGAQQETRYSLLDENVGRAARKARIFTPKMYQSSRMQKEYCELLASETIFQRIQERYMGDLPGKIKSFVIYFSNHAEKIRSGRRITNTALLWGDPGVGKSYLVEVLGGELEIPVFNFSSRVFNDSMKGGGVDLVMEAFDVAKNLNQRCIMFFDEFDNIATQRTDKTHGEDRSTLNQLLTELEDIQKFSNVFVIAATNVNPYATTQVKPTITTTTGDTVTTIPRVETFSDTSGWSNQYTQRNGSSTNSSTPANSNSSHSVSIATCLKDPDDIALDKAIRSRFPNSICEIKVLTREQNASAIMHIFKDEGCRRDLFNQALANALAKQIPAHVSMRLIKGLVIDALNRSDDDGNQRCICDYFNQIFIESRDMDRDGGLISINCVHQVAPVVIASVQNVAPIPIVASIPVAAPILVAASVRAPVPVVSTGCSIS